MLAQIFILVRARQRSLRSFNVDELGMFVAAER
jgi:hypothetical protein